jgi:branched-chain amino acid transport system permease protein
MLTFLQTLSYGFINGSLYGLVALGLSLIFGVMNYLNVAHGALIMVASYAVFWICSYLRFDPFVSLILVAPTLFVIGWALFSGLFRRLLGYGEGEKIKNSLLISFGILLILSNGATLLWTADERAITTAYTGQVFDLFGIRLPYIGLASIGLAIVVVFVVHLFLTKTYFGKAIRAVSQDHEAAAWMGINISRVCMVSFAIGVTLSAFPGVIIALQTFNPSISFDLTNKALIVLVLAGVGSLKGVLLGGFLLGAVEAASVFLVGAPYREVVGLVLFVLVLMFRPQGLGGRKG